MLDECNFSTPDLLDLQSTSSVVPVESVQEKSESPWFTRVPQHQSKERVREQKRRSASVDDDRPVRLQSTRNDPVQNNTTSTLVQRGENRLLRNSLLLQDGFRVQDVDILDLVLNHSPLPTNEFHPVHTPQSACPVQKTISNSQLTNEFHPVRTPWSVCPVQKTILSAN